ncbi:hypothetical protein BH10BDE1_BH10BDE1_10860 [soil metagenome]
MSTQSRFLHSKSSQVVDPTFDISSLSKTRVNKEHDSKVPIHGARKEKRTQNLYEALIISVFLLFLFLTGCSGSMVANSRTGVEPRAVIQLTGEANLPPALDPGVSNLKSDGTGRADDSGADSSSMDGALKAFIQQDAVIERVRRVAGWLKFVRQPKSAELVEQGWARLNAGQQLGPLKTDAVPMVADLSIRELILWRQILLTTATPLPAEQAGRLEALAISLTSAMNPEDVSKLDNLLVVPERYAEY